tara:strand:- start:3378 stop:4484 length:1107 start_codon:yes stop_codon:yes gene_type:complete
MDQSMSANTQKQLHFFSNSMGKGNTLLDYDLEPRFLHGNVEKKSALADNSSKLVKTIALSNSERYEIHPATLSLPSSDGKLNEDGTPHMTQYAVYPGTRESLIEDCLILFAQNGEFSVEKGEPGYRYDRETNSIGVYFTLYQLRRELKKMSKEYRLEELREGLDVLALSKYRYINEDDRNRTRGYIVAELDSMPNRRPNDMIRSDRINFVLFDQRASQRILGGHYRSYDAQCALSMKSPIARFLYKQFTHEWQQANKKQQTGHYKVIEQNETILASGCPLLSNVTKRKTNIIKALNELHSVGIIEKFIEERDMVKIKEGRRTVDVQFMVSPTNLFIKQQIQGYKKLQESLEFGRQITVDENSRKIQVS